MPNQKPPRQRELRELLGEILRREREARYGSGPDDLRAFALALGVEQRAIHRLEAGQTAGKLEQYVAQYAFLLRPDKDPRAWWDEAITRWQAGSAPAPADLANRFATAIRDQVLRSEQKAAQGNPSGQHEPPAKKRANQ